jgi:hypothetical protein
MADTTWTQVGSVVPWSLLSGTWAAQTDTWADFRTEWTMGQGLSWANLSENWNTIDVTWGSL